MRLSPCVNTILTCAFFNSCLPVPLQFLLLVNMSHHRFVKDMAELSAWCDAQGTPVVEDTTEPSTFFATVSGPEGTPYAGGKFVIRFQIPDKYPFKSPSVRFQTPIWHPNISRDGAVCANVLKAEDWTPLLRLVEVLSIYLPELLREPNPNDPLNSGAAAMMKKDPAAFSEYVQLFTKKYAIPGGHDIELPVVTNPTVISGIDEDDDYDDEDEEDDDDENDDFAW